MKPITDDFKDKMKYFNDFAKAIEADKFIFEYSTLKFYKEGKLIYQLIISKF